MTQSRPLAPVPVDQFDRVRRGCSHVRVPDEPATRGYRYVDVGGSAAPFYLLRLTAGDVSGALTLTAPIELSSGGEAEPGAPALARAQVSVDVHSIPWSALCGRDLRSGPWAGVIEQALAELARLQLVQAHECPVCNAGLELEAA